MSRRLAISFERCPRVAAGLLAAASVFLVGQHGAAQNVASPEAVVLPRTEQRLLPSAAVDLVFKLYISVPREYDPTATRRYDVVYLLDADYSFAIVRNIVEHLSDRNDLAPMILVGVAYDGPDAYRLHRTRDYTPTSTATGGYGPEFQKVSGGGAAFRQFLADELIPYMKREFATSDNRVLVGHSYGGLFASWVATTTPSLFGRYVIVSPSLWYDDHLIFRLEKEKAKHRTDLPIRAFFAVGSREINRRWNMVRDLEAFVTQLRERDYPTLKLRSEVADDETHNSIFPRAVSSGLRFVFHGHDEMPPSLH